MRITIQRVACVLAIAATPLAACGPAESTMPDVTAAATTSQSTVEIPTAAGDTLRPCPEMRIPELPCVSDDLRGPANAP